MNEETNNHKIDPELEVRIIAWVMGEVSAFESERLLALMDSRPELAAFKAQIESTHDLMRDVATAEFPDAGQPWKLSDERRQKLLDKLDGNSTQEPAAVKVTLAKHDSDTWNRNSKWNFKAIVAAISAIAVIGLVVMFIVSQTLLSQRTESLGVSRLIGDSAEVESALSNSRSFSLSPNVRSEGFSRGGEADYVLSDLGESKGVDEFSSYQLAESESEMRFGKPVFPPGSKANNTAVPSDITTWNLDAVPTEKMSDPARLYFDDSGLKENTADRSAGSKKSGDSQAQGMAEMLQAPAPIGLQLGVPAAADAERPYAATNRFDYRNSGGMAGGMGGAISTWDARTRNETTKGAAIAPPSVPQILSPGEPLSRWTDKSANDYGSQVQVWQGYVLPNSLDSKRAAEGLSESAKQTDPSNIAEFSIELDQDENSPWDLSKSERELLDRVKDQDSLERKTAASLDEKEAKTEAFSTFSLHVSDVSFKLALSALAKGEWPEAAKIRIEEFVNAFDYGDPLPSESERVACRVEQSIHPFLQQRNLLRVSMRTAAAGRANSTPLRLTFLLDNSGSMERFDRQQTVRRAFALLASQLQPSDQVTLISFARQPRLLADRVAGAQANQLVQLVENLPSEGGTNFEAALRLAFEKATEQRTEGAQNRIVLLTDGAVNLGDANPESLSQLIMQIRDSGIAFDAAGISAEGLNDEVLEALARKGDGRYYLLDSQEDCDDGFARQIAGALRPSAKNVKVQIEFNPKRVGRYKLLGFEKHLLKQEDFRNDKVDAAEMAAAEAGVAVYQFEANPNGEGDIGLVSVRFRDLETGEMVENRWPIPYIADPPRPAQATPSMRIATCAAMFAAKLRGDAIGESVELSTLAQLLSSLPPSNLNATRVLQLQQMIEQARQMK